MVCKIKSLLIGLAILTVVQAASVTISANSDLLTRSDTIIADIRRRILVLLEDIDLISHGIAKVLSRREEVQNIRQNPTTIESNKPPAQPPTQPPVQSPVQPPIQGPFLPQQQPPVQPPLQPSVQQPVQQPVEPVIQIQSPVQYPSQYDTQPPFKPHVQPAYSARPTRPTRPPFTAYG